MKIVLNKNKFFLIFLILFSLILKIIYFYLVLNKNNNYFTADSSGYHDVAVQLANGNGFCYQDNSPEFFRLPGYSVFLAIFYKIFNFNIIKTLLAQIVLASLILVLIFFLSLVLFPENILLAQISSLISCIHFGFIIFSGLLMSESLFIFFLLLFFINFFSKNFFNSGLFLGIASLIRPVGVYLVILSIILIFFLFKNNFIKKFKFSFLIFLIWAFIVSFWLIRNFLLTGFIFFHTLPGKHFLNHTASYIVMQKYNLNYNQAKEKISQEYLNLIKEKELKESRNLKEIETCLIAEKIANNYIINNKILFIKYSFINILKTTFCPFSQELIFIQEKNKSLNLNFIKISYFIEIFFILFFYLGFLGFIFKNFLKIFFDFKILFSLLFVFLFIFITLAAGFARLRLPIECFIVILSLKFWLDIFNLGYKC